MTVLVGLNGLADWSAAQPFINVQVRPPLAGALANAVHVSQRGRDAVGRASGRRRKSDPYPARS